MEKKEEKVVEKENSERKETEALVTSRILFISALDKIFLLILIIMLVCVTYSCFNGDISSMNYEFFSRVGDYILSLLAISVMYLLFNWIYRCAAKTMLCLTEKEVYKESYFPFKKSEKNIPLQKITSVSTLDLFWIFRLLIIHQYNNLPMFFWTWNNHEFKDKLNEIITKDKDKVKNEFVDKHIISRSMLKYIKYLGLGLLGLIVLIGIVRFFGYMFNSARNISGEYTYKKDSIVLNKNGKCNLDDIIDDVINCTWEYNENKKEVNIDYEYEYEGWYSSYTTTDSITLKYNEDKKTLEYHGNIYKK